MKVLDATLLVDYGNGVESVSEYLERHADERFVVPPPAFTVYLLGLVHSSEPTDLQRARTELAWTDVFEVDDRTAVTAAEVADEIGPKGPNLSAIDALVAAVGRELDVPIVSADGDLAHEETKMVVDVEEYR